MVDTEGYGLRKSIYELMDRWENYDPHGDDAVKRLHCILRGKEGNFAGYNEVMTDEEIDICQKLTGVHGYAYYRALLIIKGMVDEDDRH